MTNKEYEVLFRQVILPKILETRESGGQEYARTEDNIFANFERVSETLDISVEECIMVYSMKHLDGIVAHIQGTTSQREDVRGRITDLIVYMTLLWGYLVKDESIQKDKVIQRSQDIDSYDNFKDESENIKVNIDDRQPMDANASKRFKKAPNFNPKNKEWEASWSNPPSWDGNYTNIPDDLIIQKMGDNPINSDGSKRGCCGGNKRANPIIKKDSKGKQQLQNITKKTQKK